MLLVGCRSITFDNHNMNDKADELSEKILTIVKKNPKGISASHMSAAVPELSSAELVGAINKLLQQGYLDIYKQDGALIYK